MYKDKDKQRKADAERQRRYRASKGVTSQNVTKDVTNEALTSRLTPERDKVGTKLPMTVGDLPAADRDRVLKVLQPIKLHPAIIAGIDRVATDEQDRANRTANAKSYQRLYPDQPYKGIGIAPADIRACSKSGHVRVSKPGDADYRPLCAFTREWCVKHGVVSTEPDTGYQQDYEIQAHE